MKSPKLNIDIFVLNYNGAEYVSSCIASLLEAIKNSVYPCQLWVIDNKSQDNSVALVQKEFPTVPILEIENNRVLCSFNDAASQSKADIVFLLNNDLKADSYFIDPMVSVFLEKKDVFLVAAKSFLFDGSYEGGRSIPSMSFGTFTMTCRYLGFEKFMDRPGITFSAGFGAFDRRKFVELNGFDDLYLPGRMEDADLALRAWKRGWKCYYQPKSILYHVGGKSFKERFGVRGTMEIAHRNTFLFMWKNIQALEYWLAHYFFLLPRMIWVLLHGHSELLTGFIKALPKLKQALLRRHREKKVPYQYSDREVLSFFHHEH